MGRELSYETYVCGVLSDNLEEELRFNEEWKRKIENEIFALIAMDPSKVRNQKNSDANNSDDEDYSWMNNAQYISKVWEDLKEQWEEAQNKIAKYSDALGAIERKNREVKLCPDCMVEIDCSPNKDNNWKWEWKCPKCGKIYQGDFPSEEEENLPKPTTATINTWYDSY